MENEKQQVGKKKTVMMIVGAVIVLAVIIAIILSMPKNNEQQTGPGGENIQTPEQGDVTTPGGEEAGIPEGEEGMEPIEAEVTNPVLEGAVTVAPGADLITTDGKVVNQEGTEVEAGGGYDNPLAPRQTQALSEEEQEQIEQAIKLTLDSNGFNPSEFRVNAGEAVVLTLTGLDESSHILAFADSSMNATYINIRPGETRAVTFNAPSDPGEYTFFCDFPGHRGRGEQGVMIVE